MGRSRNQRRSTKLFDTDDDSLSSTSTGGLSDLTIAQEVEVDGSEDLVLDNHLDALYEKRASTRENGLKGFISAFTNDVQYEFAESKSETLLDQLMKSMKRGSSTEVALAAHAAGLLAITIGAGDIAHKVMEDSIPNFSRACKIGSDAENYSMVLQSLAVVTFVGGTDFEETEKSMDLLWQQISGTNKTQPAVKAAAISAWAFLLTTLPTHQLDSQFCKRCLPLLSTLLEDDNRAVRIAAGEAIALIFETVNSEDEILDNSDNLDPGSFDLDNFLQARILEQMTTLSIEASGKGSSKKDLNSQRSSFRDILASIQGGMKPEATVKLQNGDVVNVSTWTQIIQTNFLRHFLGGGFQKHMQVNSLLHEIFSFTPSQEKQQALSAKEKRLYMSPNSAASKARTQQRNKRRSAKQERVSSD
ncbi:uncharacterized protein LOC131069511 isoform X1 [Cryptomeria japonica]|uniref:uncharacterized protein LOC131069511 isoform X1 n=1 Tax=Cryptomeria japonica TaxID=3369 RepID=UPI0027D9E49C|nr:uncharacterized protein LOC131069511 isoform X1 [Cryptomeria japonica]XP_057860963.2 uncharacterized protein LOC131069511 isoform X1 [Cryptomeria japonica]